MIKLQNRFENTIASFDGLNAEDPNLLSIDGSLRPKELVYAQRMSQMLDQFAPDASEALKLATRCQHIQRWKIARDSYPMTKPGYYQWRTALKQFHAELAASVLRDNAYDEATIAKVSSLLTKENLKTDEETQTLEDVIVLVFLQYDLEDFVNKHSDYDESKFIDILRKSYFKMSEKGRTAALTLISLPTQLMPVIQKAIS